MRRVMLAMDEARFEREDDGERSREEAFMQARDAELDAREAALDWREAEGDAEKDDAEAKDRKAARDARAIARDRRAHDRRSKGARDALPDPKDPRRDFRSNAEDSARRLAQDEARAAGCPNVSEVFPAPEHPYRNHQ